MPNNWKIYKLGEIYKTTSGLSKASKEFGFGNPFVTFKDVFYNYFLPNELENLVNTNDKEIKSCSVLKGDIFLTRTSETMNELGMSSVALKDYPNATFNGFSKRLRLIENSPIKIDPIYIGYYLRSSYFRYEVNKLASMTTRASLNNDAIYSIKIVLPPYEEQIEIGKILKPIDDKIENNLTINKTLEEMAMALYKHWFVDFGPFQDSEFEESELGMIPKGWEVKKIGDLVSVIGGYAFKSKWFQETGIKVLKIKNINNNIVDISKCDCISEEVSKSINSKFKVTEGDFLVAMTGAEVGKVGVVPNYSQDLWLNQRVGKFNDKEIKNASILIGKIMQTNDFYKIIQGLAYGSAQPNISTSDIENIDIILPNDKNILNTLINDFVHLHNITIENLTENETLTQLRDTLLPQLISGALRLKEFRE